MLRSAGCGGGPEAASESESGPGRSRLTRTRTEGDSAASRVNSLGARRNGSRLRGPGVDLPSHRDWSESFNLKFKLNLNSESTR